MIDATHMSRQELHEVQTGTVDGGYTGNAWAGSKYRRGQDVADVAKELRKDIRQAVKDGELPKARYSVRISRYSGGCSLSVTVKDAPVLVINPEWERYQLENPNVFPSVHRHTEAWVALERVLEGLANAYQRSDVESMIDYYNVAFSLSVGPDFDWEQAQRKELLSWLRAGFSPKPKDWRTSR